MADKKKPSQNIENYRELYQKNNDRHSKNARAAAAIELQTPRINTDNL